MVIIQSKSGGASGGNYARISINDAPVEVDYNTHGHRRGLHIVVFHPINGKI